MRVVFLPCASRYEYVVVRKDAKAGTVGGLPDGGGGSERSIWVVQPAKS